MSFYERVAAGVRLRDVGGGAVLDSAHSPLASILVSPDACLTN